MTISQRIFYLLMQQGRKQKELSEFTGISTSTVSAWNKRGSAPSSEDISIIADFFNVSIEFLVTGKEKSSSNNLTKDEQELLDYYKMLTFKEKQRLIGRASLLAEQQALLEGTANIIELSYISNKVSAGLGDELEDYENKQKLSVVETAESRKADFILSVDGDSMEPKFHDGDFVLVRQQPAVDIGQIGIFDVDGKGYIKKFDGDYLISLNPDYDDISLLNKEFKCFGLVLGIAEVVE
ncbi:MAG: helix-turn-helix domain-containing protein [Huintestinicola sp.]